MNKSVLDLEWANEKQHLGSWRESADALLVSPLRCSTLCAQYDIKLTAGYACGTTVEKTVKTALSETQTSALHESCSWFWHRFNIGAFETSSQDPANCCATPDSHNVFNKPWHLNWRPFKFFLILVWHGRGLFYSSSRLHLNFEHLHRRLQTQSSPIIHQQTDEAVVSMRCRCCWGEASAGYSPVRMRQSAAVWHCLDLAARFQAKDNEPARPETPETCTCQSIKSRLVGRVTAHRSVSSQPTDSSLGSFKKDKYKRFCI